MTPDLRIFAKTFLASILVLAVSLSAGCADLSRRAAPDRARLAAAAGSQQECFPRFPDQGGWLGADAAYSLPRRPPSGDLAESRQSLWFFGDSFFSGAGNASDQRSYPFIHNTVAISTCEPDGDWAIEYFAGEESGGDLRDFIAPDPDAEWVRRALESRTTGSTGSAPYYWLFDGFYLGETLFIGLLRVAHDEPRGDFQLPFRLFGVDLARIENAHRSPAEWNIRITTLSNDLEVFPAASFVVQGDALHAFAFIDRGDGRSPRTLLRLPLDALEIWSPDVSARVEKLTVREGWSRMDSEAAERILMDDDATEMSVDLDAASKRWVSVYSRLPSAHSGEESGKIWLRFANRLEGPWSTPRAIYEVPEMDASKTSARIAGADLSARTSRDPAIEGEVHCYAGKAHPQFAGPRRILLTYVCNLFAPSPEATFETLHELTERKDLYRPRAVSIPMPQETFEY